MSSGQNDDWRSLSDVIKDVAENLGRIEVRLNQQTGQDNNSGLEDLLREVQAGLSDIRDRVDQQEQRQESRWQRLRAMLSQDRRSWAPAGLVFALAIAGIAWAGVEFFQSARLSAEEQQCTASVQGRIAWDDGKTTWDSSALARLCQGTTEPAQPGLCFYSIFNARLEDGAAIQSDWKDAVALCAGTDNAQARVQCYKDEVGRGVHFQDAIEACNPPPEVAGQTACERLVQGNIAWNDAGDTAWTPRRLDLLCEETARPTQPLLCFDRLFHGKGPWDEMIGGNWRRAALLCSGTNSVRDTTACVNRALKTAAADSESTPRILDRGEPVPASVASPEETFGAVLNACNPRRTTDRSARCKSFVQGNIPWSDAGYRDWQPEVLAELCGKTRAPQQPGLCFFRAMQGEISEARQGLSKWAYAVRLCSGTNDANTRLACYKREREAGKESRAAINACKDAAED